MNVRTLTASGLTDVWRNGSAIAASVGVLALGLLFHTEVAAAVYVWSTSTAYNHCFLVIPIVLYLLWDRREVLEGAVAEPMPMAALAGIPLAIAWLVAERVGIMEGRQLVAMTFVELLFFIVLGPRLWWQLAGPLLYLYFLVPFGAFLTPDLQDFTTWFVKHGLRIVGIPAYITGYTIEIPEGAFLIAEACAGLRFLIAAVAFGCLYSLIMYRSAIRRTVFIVASIIVPIIANGFRALGIVSLGHILGSAQAAETDHILYGWMFFSIVILILIALGLPFREDQQPLPPLPPRPRRLAQQNHLRPAIVGTTGVILLAAISPSIAAGLDGAARPDMALVLPTLVPTAGCIAQPMPLTDGLDAPGRMMVQRFNCGAGIVTLAIEVFSPRSPAGRLISEQRHLNGTEGAEDVQSDQVSVRDTPPGAWRIVAVTGASRIAASSLWVEGRPAHLGLAERARQAWRSIVGSRSSPVLAVVWAERDQNLPEAAGQQQAARSVAGFLQSQPQLTDLIEQLGGSAAVKE